MSTPIKVFGKCTSTQIEQNTYLPQQVHATSIQLTY